MAQSLYARVAKRGFPVQDISGQSGQGALQDSTAPPQTVGQPGAPWEDPNNDPGYTPTGIPAPEEYQLGLSLWGLPGSPNPDDTPRTHAAPLIDPGLATTREGLPLAYIEADATKSQEFTGVTLTRPASGSSWVGTEAEFGFDQQLVEGNGQTNLASVPDQLKGQGGLDAVQGFGGGGPGQGGTNEPALTVLDREFPGPEGSVVFTDANEVPFIVPATFQFIPSDPALGPWVSPYDVPTYNVSQQDTLGADIPSQGPTLDTPAPAYASSFWS
jgi:hypothetical protein